MQASEIQGGIEAIARAALEKIAATPPNLVYSARRVVVMATAPMKNQVVVFRRIGKVIQVEIWRSHTSPSVHKLPESLYAQAAALLEAVR